MRYEFKYNQKIYYVPEFDKRLARHIPITQLRLSQVPPLLELGCQVRLSPRSQANGKVGQTGAGTFWISKEAYEAYEARTFKQLLQCLFKKVWPAIQSLRQRLLPGRCPRLS
jgi:hypothetical protein